MVVKIHIWNTVQTLTESALYLQTSFTSLPQPYKGKSLSINMIKQTQAMKFFWTDVLLNYILYHVL